jgi:hemoglobin/transferrin/lactoferrin receptor protein
MQKPLISILFVSLSALPAWAEEGEDRAKEEEKTRLDTITVVGTRTERAISDVAATVSVITEEDIAEQVARDIADLVRFEPGVTVAGTGSRFGLGGFNIRGIGGNRVLTLVDGVRVAEEFSFGPFLSARRDFIDVDSLERAEIARGPISSLYGSDALGGVVALTTLGPRDYVGADDGLYGGFRGGWSSADDSMVSRLTVATGNERLAGMVAWTRREGQETETAGSVGGFGSERELADPQDIETNNFMGKVSWVPADGHELTASIDVFDNQTDTRIFSDYGEVVRGTLVERRDAFDERERTRFSLAYDYSGDTWFADDVMATVYTQTSETRQVTTEDRIAPGGVPQSRERLSLFEQDIDGGFVQLGKGFETGPASHYVTWGVDYFETANQSIRDGGTFAADGTPVFEFFPFPTRDFPITDVEQLAFFLQDEISFLDGRLLLSPGLRYDRFEADARSDLVYETGNPGQPTPEDYADSELTTRLGAVFHFNETWSVYGRYSEGFRAPPYDDVNIGFTNFIGGYKSISNPNLESERSEGYEAGLRVGGRLGVLNLAVFTNDYENFIESRAIAPQFLATGGIDPADGLLTLQSVNRQNVEISGAEVSGSLDLGGVSDWLTGMSMRFAVAYAEGEDAQGVPVNTIEPLTGVFGLGYDAIGGRWGAELILTAVDGKDEDDIDPSQQRLPTAGYGIVDLLAHYTFTDRIRLNVGLFNLTDRTYIRWADTQSIGNDAPARFTQPGFNVGVNLRVEL